jgi:Flp pilus assembly protein CpaB
VSQRRTLILVAAIAIGGLASFLVWNYVNGVQDQAYAGAERVPVYLVKQEIPRGTTGTAAQAYIAKETIPRKFMPGNAIANLEDISGKVAVSKLVPNQVVVADMFVDASDPQAQQSFAERLTKIRGKDMVTVTISASGTAGVNGLIQPGDYVNIMLVDVQTTTDSSTGKTVQKETSLLGHARYLYQKVLVLAVGNSAVPLAGEATNGSDAAATPPASGSGLITFIVPTDAAQVLAGLSNGGGSSLYLSLVSPDYKPTQMSPLPTTDTTPAEDASVETPYGPKGAVSAN